MIVERIRSVTLTIRLAYRTSIATNTAKVASTAWTTIPSNASE